MALSLSQSLAELAAAWSRVLLGYHTAWPAAWRMPAPGSLTSSKATLMGLDARMRTLRDGLQAQASRLEGCYQLSEAVLQLEEAFQSRKGRARVLRRRPLLPTFAPCNASSGTQRCIVASHLLLSPYSRVHCFVLITGRVRPPHTSPRVSRPYSKPLRMSSTSTGPQPALLVVSVSDPPQVHAARLQRSVAHS